MWWWAGFIGKRTGVSNRVDYYSVVIEIRRCFDQFQHRRTFFSRLGRTYLFGEMLSRSVSGLWSLLAGLRLSVFKALKHSSALFDR